MPEPKQVSSAPPPSHNENTDAKADVAPASFTPVAEIRANGQLIERAVSTLEPRFTHRVLRSLTTLRRKLNADILKDAFEAIYPKGVLRHIISHIARNPLTCIAYSASPGLATLIEYIPPTSRAVDTAMEVDDVPAAATMASKTSFVPPVH